MCRFDFQSHPILPELITGLIAKAQGSQDGGISAAFLDVLLAAQLISYAGAVHVLEYGCAQGQFSFHLAEIIGSFCSQSTLTCASNTIEPAWLEKMSEVTHMPQLSFLAGDYGSLHLEKNFFDIAFINGTTDFTDPFAVITDTLQLLKSNGVILCYLKEPQFLQHALQIVFSKTEEFEICPNTKIILAKTEDNEWIDLNQDNPEDFESLLQKHIKEAEHITSLSHPDKNHLTQMALLLQNDIQKACQAQRNDLKIRLLQCKEQLFT